MDYGMWQYNVGKWYIADAAGAKLTPKPGCCLNIKIISYQYKKFHFEEQRAVRKSFISTSICYAC